MRLHGGGLFAGSNAEASITTGAFARDGIVEVTANSRLGLFGYFDLGDGSCPNRGLLDHIAVLQWVRRNIAAFGGDPDRVTVAGHSAGGFSSAELMASPLAHGLFSQVFLASGASSARHDRQTASLVREIVTELAGASSTAELLTLPTQQLLAAQAQAIEDCYTHLPAEYGRASVLGLPFEHTVDDQSVVADVPSALASAARTGVPLLVGTTTGECVFHVSHLPEDLSLSEAFRVYDGMVRPLGLTGRDVVRAYADLMPRARLRDLRATINAIAPRLVKTSMTERWKQDPEVWDAIASTNFFKYGAHLYGAASNSFIKRRAATEGECRREAAR